MFSSPPPIFSVTLNLLYCMLSVPGYTHEDYPKCFTHKSAPESDTVQVIGQQSFVQFLLHSSLNDVAKEKPRITQIMGTRSLERKS